MTRRVELRLLRRVNHAANERIDDLSVALCLSVGADSLQSRLERLILASVILNYVDKKSRCLSGIKVGRGAENLGE